MKVKLFIAVPFALAMTVVLAACGGGGNSAEGINTALANYLNAQSAFSAPVGDTSPNTVNEAWVQTNAENLAQMRETFEVLRTEAEKVDFPATFEQRGEPSQSTIDEYLTATDSYIAFNEQMQAETEGCIASGGTPYDCALRIGVLAMTGAYPDVVKRAQTAAIQLRDETSVQ
jgi:hypothetical protein